MAIDFFCAPREAAPAMRVSQSWLMALCSSSPKKNSMLMGRRQLLCLSLVLLVKMPRRLSFRYWLLVAMETTGSVSWRGKKM